MLFVLVGLAALVVVPGAVIAAAAAAWVLTARALRIPEFRPLKTPPPGAFARRLAVRAASVAAAFSVCFLAAFAGALSMGITEPTLHVRVLDGPAKRAGVEDGDRIVAVDGASVASFDEMRGRVQNARGPVTLTLDRRGTPITRTVTPGANHRIGVESQPGERRSASFGEAAASAGSVAFVARLYLRTGEKRASLMGPIGIVKATATESASKIGPSFMLAALVAAWVWPVVLAFQILDALIPVLRRAGAEPPRP
jgi:membrane-associated protease RseP (regulator of RpoE activity)